MSEQMTESEIDALAERIADINSPSWRAEVKRILREALCATPPKPATAKVIVFVPTGEYRVATPGEFFRWDDTEEVNRCSVGTTGAVHIYRRVESNMTALDLHHALYSLCAPQTRGQRCDACERIRATAKAMEGRP